jgi:hypothetical protein
MKGVRGEEGIEKKYVERVQGAALESVTRRIHENPKHPFSNGADNDGPADRTGPYNGESGAPVAIAALPSIQIEDKFRICRRPTTRDQSGVKESRRIRRVRTSDRPIFLRRIDHNDRLTLPLSR